MEFPNNPFEVFGLPKIFQVDRALLEKQYLQFNRQYHPDLGESLEREMRVRRLALINKAYRELLDPKARFLLLVKDLPDLPDSEKILPSGFLVEQMEIQEDLETALKQKQNLEQKKIECDQKIKDHWQKIEHLFEQIKVWDEDSLRSLWMEYNCLPYWYRIQSRIEAQTDE